MVAHRKHGDGTRAFSMFPAAKISLRKRKIRNNCYAGENLCWNPPAMHEKGAPGPWNTCPRTGSAYVPVLPTDAAVLKTSLSVFRYGMTVSLDPVPVTAGEIREFDRHVSVLYGCGGKSAYA